MYGQYDLVPESVHANYLLAHDVSICFRASAQYTIAADHWLLMNRTHLLRQFWVKVCAGYTLAGYIAVELTLFLNCRPFMGYFMIPPPQQQCATYFNYEVTQAVFNISSDLAILLVIIPTLWKMNMSNREKVPILIIFGMGFFMVSSLHGQTVYQS